MVPIPRYLLFFFFSGPPADHRILVFQVVASVYSVCAEIRPLFQCAANEQALDYQ